MNFKDLFRVNTSVNNVKNNEIKISTNKDIMFQIGKDLGEIKISLQQNSKDLNYVKNKLKEHDKRLSILESEIKAGK